MAKQELTYSKALSELEKIVLQIEHNEVDIDRLSDSVKRASELLQFCRDKLTKTENEISNIMKSIEGTDHENN